VSARGALIKRQEMILSKYLGCCWRLSCVVVLFSLQACAIADPKTMGYAPDKTITSALASQGERQEDENLEKDGKIIRNLIVKTSLSHSSLQEGMVWENSDTGSRGIISSIQPIKEGDRTCHAFKTTREAFDGVMVYEGKACETANGSWVLNQFRAQ